MATTTTNNRTPTTSGQASGDSPQSDPLLESGSFIIDPNKVSIHPNGVRREPPKSAEKPQMSHNSSNGEVAQETDVSSAPAGPRRFGTGAGDTSWLPAGWLIEERVRSTGATAGTVDRYYFDPVSNRRFRSKKEVVYFLEHGTVRKKKKEPESSDVGADTAEGSGGSKTKKSKTKPTTSTSPAGFGFNNIPDKVIWSLTDASKDSWTPSLPGDETVTESTKEEWAAAFSSLTKKTTDQKKI